MFPSPNISKYIMQGFFQTCFLCFYLQHAIGKSTDTAVQLGDVVFLHNKISYIYTDHDEVKWKHNNRFACRLQAGTLKCSDGYDLLKNGTLKINIKSKSKSGNYTSEIFHKNGTCMSTVNYELIVLEAISEPDVHKACTVDGRAVLTCSVKRGDKVRFQWMLHPNSSEGTAPLLGHIQYFDRQTPGYLICETENEISRKKSAPVTMKCRGYVSTLVTLGIVIAVLIFVMAVWAIRKKLPKRERKGTPVLKACTNPETRADSQNDVALQCSDVKENIYVEMHGDLGKKDKDGKAFTAVLDIFHSDACNTVSSATYRNTTENIEDMENVYV